jgi:hypothetical protein
MHSEEGILAAGCMAEEGLSDTRAGRGTALIERKRKAARRGWPLVLLSDFARLGWRFTGLRRQFNCHPNSDFARLALCQAWIDMFVVPPLGGKGRLKPELRTPLPPSKHD